MQDITTLHFITVFSVWSFKLATLIVGYLITRMGYDLLTKGVTGGFKFSGDFSGVKADIASASPGLLFLVLGVVLMTASILNENKFSTSVKQEQPSITSNQTDDTSAKPALFDFEG